MGCGGVVAGALSRRASVAGVDESTVEQALDDGDQARLVAEIVARESPAQKPGAVERISVAVLFSV